MERRDSRFSDSEVESSEYERDQSSRYGARQPPAYGRGRSESYREYSESGNEERGYRKSSSGASAIRWLEVFFLFVAFVFMAFAASTPVTKKFYLFSVKITVNALIDKVSDEYTFGVWGYCSSGVKNSFGIGKAKINSKVTGGGCSDRKLGWTFKDIPGLSDDTQHAISEALTVAFVLHVVAAVLIFPALCAAVVGAAKPDLLVKGRQARSDEYSDSEYREKYDDDYREPDAQDVSSGRRRLRGVVALFILISLIFTMAVFILDVAGVVLTKNKVHHKSKGAAKLDFGPAFWFVVAAFGLVLVSLFIAFIDLTVVVGRHTPQYDDDAATQGTSRRGSTAASRQSEISGSSYSQGEHEFDEIPVTPTRDGRGRYSDYR